MSLPCLPPFFLTSSSCSYIISTYSSSWKEKIVSMKFILSGESSPFLGHYFSRWASWQGEHHADSSMFTIPTGFKVLRSFSSCWGLVFEPITSFCCLTNGSLRENCFLSIFFIWFITLLWFWIKWINLGINNILFDFYTVLFGFFQSVGFLIP